MQDEIFLVDTVIIIYAYEVGEDPRKKKALEILEQCWKGKIPLAVSNQNLAEFSFVALKKLKLTSNIVQKVVKDISNFKGFRKISYKRKTLISATEISEKNNMSFWDSLISATMIENKISSIYTENAKNFKISSIKVINPFIEIQ